MKRTVRELDEFVCFEGSIPRLYCYIASLLPSGDWECVVFNGAWNFVMNPDSGEASWRSPSGHGSATFTFVMASKIPGLKPGDYNDVLNQITAMGYSPGKWMLRERAKDLWSGLLHGFSKVARASHAFWCVLTGAGHLTLNNPYQEGDNDDIPF